MIQIITNRHESKNVAWQIVHEWEDVFVSHTDIDFLYKNEFRKNFFEKIRYNKSVVKILPPLSIGENKIIFQMSPPYEFNYFSSCKCIPIIIDVWKSDFNRIKEFCKYNKWVFIGSLEAVGQLNKIGVHNISYLPVSISNIYKRDSIPVKDIDLITYGRNHLIMNEWMEKLKSDTKLNVVHCAPDDNGRFCAWSSQTGYLGEVKERKSLMDLIARSKYTAVSSPGNDTANEMDMLRTGGISPVTPRFLEAAVNYSIGIGIFPDNADYTHCNVHDAAIAVSSYDAFEAAIKQTPDYDHWKTQIDNFLEQHWTDRRVEEVLRKIENVNSKIK